MPKSLINQAGRALHQPPAFEANPFRCALPFHSQPPSSPSRPCQKANENIRKSFLERKFSFHEFMINVINFHALFAKVWRWWNERGGVGADQIEGAADCRAR